MQISQIQNIADQSGSGTISGTTTVVANTNGCSVVNFRISGTYSATLIFEASVDSSTFFAVTGLQVATQTIVSSVTSATATIQIPCAGYQQVQVRCPAYTSGTANIAWDASVGSSLVTVINQTPSNLQTQVTGIAADGAAVSGNPVRVAGSDGTNTQDLLTDTAGRQIIVGAAADGAAVTGNPVLVAGFDGTNTQTLLTDTAGKLLTKGGADTSGTASFTAAAQEQVVPTSGASTIGFEITGTFTGVTYIFQGSVDGGTTYRTIQGWSSLRGTITSGDNSTGSWIIDCGGYTHVKIRTSALSTGTVNVAYYVTAAPSGRPTLAINSSNQLVPSTTTDNFASGNLSGTGTVQATTSGCATATVNISGTWAGTLQFEGNYSGGVVAIKAVNLATGQISTTTTTNGDYLIACAGFPSINVDMTSFTSGTATIKINVGVGAPPQFGPIVAPSFREAVTAGYIGTNSGEVMGRVTAAAASEVAVNETTYTVQGSNAQRSVSSGSANDTSAGTGARTVRITYYSQTGTGAMTGPFTEDVTLNGTTTVNTVSTAIRHIESVEVITAGSGGTNAGVITLFAATAGGGGAVVTIATGSRKTRNAIHHVPSGLTCYVSDIMASASAALLSTQADTFELRTLDLSNSAAAERVLKQNISQNGAGTSSSISMMKPLKVVGPARIAAYVTPSAVTSHVAGISFSYVEV